MKFLLKVKSSTHKCTYQLVVWSPMFTDRALILLQAGTNYDNHTLIFTPDTFKVSNTSLNLIGHVNISTSVT